MPSNARPNEGDSEEEDRWKFVPKVLPGMVLPLALLPLLLVSGRLSVSRRSRPPLEARESTAY